MNKKKIGTLLIALLTITAMVGCNGKSSSSSSSSASSASESSGASSSSSSSSSSSGQQVIDLTSLALNKSATTILVGSSETLTVTYTPNNATDKEVVWSSDNATIASVNNGVVTALKVGTTNIKVTSKNKSTIFASCAVTVKDNVVLSNVSLKHEFSSFEQNRAKDEKEDAGFYDHEQTYKVGDDNGFNVKPELTVLDAKTYQPVSASKWLYDFTISAKLNDTVVGEEYFKVTDARECNVKFTEAAVGKSFTISVAPGGVDASRLATLTKSFTVEVVDGYNVYNAKELGYFDTRPQDSIQDTPIMEDDKDWQCKWEEFKTANGMDPNYHPASLIFQKDIKVTVDDLPANFFYTKEQLKGLNDDKSIGSLVDFTFLYERTIAGDITVDGNYFDLDLSEIPLVKRDRQKTTEVGAVVSHAAAFKAIAGNDVTFRNINMTGNAKKAENDDDKIYSGGFIFVKGAGSKSLKAYNMIATKFYITFFGEDPYDGVTFTEFELDKVKCYNDYNSFMYNWGSKITASNSLFRNCGGPVIIQDHIDTDVYEKENGLIIEGLTPTTNFIDCDIKNLVNGTEAWFQQFGVTSMVQDIKALSDLLAATGLPKSFVVNDKFEGKLTTALASENKPSFFNFIALNKSGSAEGATNTSACGTVNFIESDKTTTFNYRQPDASKDTAIQAYLVYAADKTPENQQALIAAMMAKGVEFAPDFSDAEAKITEYVTNFVIEHAVLRGINTNGGPVYDLGPEYDLLSYDGKNAYLQNILAVYAQTPAKYVATPKQLAATPNQMALYYNGMMLAMGLYPYVF